jgi:hypothetical protein
LYIEKRDKETERKTVRHSKEGKEQEKKEPNKERKN